MKTFNFEYKDFEELVDRFGQANSQKLGNRFLEQSMKGMSQFVLDRTKARTPVGSYGGAVSFTSRRGNKFNFSASSSRTGGLLRRSWHRANMRHTGKGVAVEIVNDASVVHNPVHPLAKNRGIYYYAESVEEGHIATTIDRIPNATDVRPVKETPVAGVYMLESSLQEIESDYYPILEQDYRIFLNRYLGGK